MKKKIEAGHKITFKDGTVLVCVEVSDESRGCVFGNGREIGGDGSLHQFWGRFRWSRNRGSFVQF